MKNALNNQVGMLGGMFLWLVANLKQGVIYFIKQTCGNEIMPSVYKADGNTYYSKRFAKFMFSLCQGQHGEKGLAQHQLQSALYASQ